MKINKDSIWDRIKGYENNFRYKLLKKVPVIIRIDWKCFHKYTKQLSFDKPFDNWLIDNFIKTIIIINSEIQWFKLAYHQSDEASFLLSDLDSIETEAWYHYNINKINSVIASLFTAYFNQQIWLYKNNLALFDARCFNIPKEDIPNYFLWRQQDRERNSLFMYVNYYYSSKELYWKWKSEQHEMLYKRGYNWNDLDNRLKNWTYIYKKDDKIKLDSLIKPKYDEINNLINKIL